MNYLAISFISFLIWNIILYTAVESRKAVILQASSYCHLSVQITDDEYCFQGFIQLSEAEVMEHFVSVEARKKKLMDRKLRSERRKQRRMIAEEMAQRLAQSRLQRKMEQQGETGIMKH